MSDTKEMQERVLHDQSYPASVLQERQALPVPHAGSSSSLTWRFGKAVLAPGVRVAVKLRVFGRENLRPNQAQIVACNHTSHADPVLVGYATGLETSFLAKEEVFKASRFLGWLIRTYHAMPVNRGAGDIAAFRNCSDVLRRNRTLILFPEGTRSKSGRLQPLRPGLALLAIINQAPIVPAIVKGVRTSFLPWLVDPDIIRSNRQNQESPLRFRISSIWNSRVEVHFGTAINPLGLTRSKSDCLRLTEQVAQAMAELAIECGAEPERNPSGSNDDRQPRETR